MPVADRCVSSTCITGWRATDWTEVSVGDPRPLLKNTDGPRCVFFGKLRKAMTSQRRASNTVVIITREGSTNRQVGRTARLADGVPRTETERFREHHSQPLDLRGRQRTHRCGTFENDRPLSREKRGIGSSAGESPFNKRGACRLGLADYRARVRAADIPMLGRDSADHRWVASRGCLAKPGLRSVLRATPHAKIRPEAFFFEERFMN